jgi:hypothetical protein
MENKSTITQQKLNQLPSSHSPTIDVDHFNPDEKGFTQPLSPSGTDTTDDPPSNSDPNIGIKTANFQNTQSMIDEKIA